MRELLELYFIAGTQDAGKEQLPVILEEALKSGVTAFQFREKGEGSMQDPKEKLDVARLCQRICKKYTVPFFVNDDVDLALEVEADGVHVGQSDQPIEEVIKRCGKQMLIGYSTNNWEQYVEAAEMEGIDYAGVGPIFGTQSKADAQPIVGTSLLKQINESSYELPVVAIGGITEENVREVWQAGPEGVSVISAITKSENIRQSVKNLQRPLS